MIQIHTLSRKCIAAYGRPVYTEFILTATSPTDLN